jgi:hypothetical protein
MQYNMVQKSFCAGGKREKKGEEMREERELGPSAHLRQTLLGRQCIEPHDGQNGD